MIIRRHSHHHQQPLHDIMMMATINNNIGSASRRLRIERKDSAEMSVTNEEESSKEKKRVSFCPDVVLAETLHHKDYTKVERLKSWYLKPDFIRMRREYYQETIEKEGHERTLERRAIRKLSRSAVVEGQEKLMLIAMQETGCCSIRNGEEEIASCYVVFSKYCAFEAYNTGLTAEVEAFCKNTAHAGNNNVSVEEKIRVKSRQQQQQQCHHQQRQNQNNSFSRLLRKHGEDFLGSYFLACT